jgi:hypothetical protein
MFRKNVACLLGSLFTPILLSASAFAGEVAAVPQEAQVAISRIRNAALSKDFATLRSSMPKTSRLYFGSEEAGIDAILSEWKKRPDYFLVDLASVLTACQLMPAGKEPTVDCYGPTDEIFRARFRIVDGAWKMLYMISGD